MPERPYMSIGDVLTLLRTEFPDITISKIRFLESRGLLVPERTPSGYRKFYDHDVDRLRWILRQQREHFLPLKVIKGRLEGNDPSSERQPLFEMGGEQANNGVPAGARANTADHGHHGEEADSEREGRDEIAAAAVAASTAAARRELQRVEESAERAAGGGALGVAVTDRPRRDGTSHPAEAGTHPSSREPTHVRHSGPAARQSGGQAASATPSQPSPARESVTAEHARPARPTAEAAGAKSSPDPEAQTPTESHAPPAGRETAQVGAAGSAVEATTGEDAGETRRSRSSNHERGAETSSKAGRSEGKAPKSDEAMSRQSGAAFTANELANASGLNIELVGQLESFGLISGRNVAGVHCYDEAALEIASVAAHFARFGVEARHLRLFKHAAERQSGLYSQVVMPVLRQRNPEARRRAAEELDRLAELGAELQASFVRAMLRDMTGG